MAEHGDLYPPHSYWKMPLFVFFKDARKVFKNDALGMEIIRIAVPAAMALAADPIASLIDTAYIGRLGSVEIATVGVCIAIFNQASKIAIFPLVSITTSFVAQEETVERMNIETSKGDDSEKYVGATYKSQISADPTFENLERNLPENGESDNLTPEIGVNSTNQKHHIVSASTALLFSVVLGLIQTLFLIFAAKPLLGLMGVKSGSPILAAAQRFLVLRSLGAPAVLLSLAMQGVFRGFKDTTTPFYATGDVTNIILDPILIFVSHMGINGAAISHVISQYFISVILFCKLLNKVYLVPPSFKTLQLGRFLKYGSLLLTRVIAVTFCVTLASSLASRLGTTHMAAFQICLQVWLTTSLLSDGLAVAGQAIIACSFAENNPHMAAAAASRVLQMSVVLGLALCGIVGAGLHFGSGIFSKDPSVLHLIGISMPFVAATQPLNSLAFVFDGVNFGASDFVYSAYSMVLVAIISICALISLYKWCAFIGLWVALAIYMSLRMIVGILRMGTGTGPWSFLRG